MMTMIPMLKLQSLKIRDGKNWRDVTADKYPGVTFQKLFEELNDCETISEILFAGHLIYLCGTKAWVTKMRDKGRKACTFAEAVTTLQRMGDPAPALLTSYVHPPECDTQDNLL